MEQCETTVQRGCLCTRSFRGPHLWWSHCIFSAENPFKTDGKKQLKHQCESRCKPWFTTSHPEAKEWFVSLKLMRKGSKSTFWISFSRTPSVINLIFVSSVTFPSYRIWYDTTLNSNFLNLQLFTSLKLVQTSFKSTFCRSNILNTRRVVILPCWQVHLFGHSVGHADSSHSPWLCDTNDTTVTVGTIEWWRCQWPHITKLQLSESKALW